MTRTRNVSGAGPTQQVGEYIAPADWNALIADPVVLVPGASTLSRACGWAASPEERDSPFYRADVYCPHCRSQADNNPTAQGA